MSSQKKKLRQRTKLHEESVLSGLEQCIIEAYGEVDSSQKQCQLGQGFVREFLVEHRLCKHFINMGPMKQNLVNNLIKDDR